MSDDYPCFLRLRCGYCGDDKLVALPKLVTPVLQILRRAITRHLQRQAVLKADVEAAAPTDEALQAAGVSMLQHQQAGAGSIRGGLRIGASCVYAGGSIAPATHAGLAHPVQAMNFVWPHNLWWMLALPCLPLLYLWLLRRRAKPALRLSSVSVARAAAGPTWRRHVPPVLVFVALTLLLLAVARPTARVTLPWAKSTIMLAIDISRSMRVTDVKPTRMVAAQDAAKAFLSEVPRHIEVGLVTFAGSAQVAQQATLERPALVAAIDAIQMQFGTAIGNGLVLSLAELFPDHGIDLSEMTFGARRSGRSLDEKAGKGKPPPKQIEPVQPGSYESAAIILLTDGRRTTGVDTLQAAKMAADRGVRVYVVGLGTPDGHLAMGEGMAVYLQLDEATLRQVAAMTGGEYHHAATAEALRNVYLNLGSRMQVSQRDTELTALLTAAAAAVLIAGTGLSLLWFGRVA